MKGLDAVPQGLKGVNYQRGALGEFYWINLASELVPVNPRKPCKGWKSFLEVLSLELLVIIFITLSNVRIYILFTCCIRVYGLVYLRL